MDYEKKYKEIVGEIKKAYLYAQTDSTKAVLEEILPELAESEGEKVRKDMLEYCYKRMNNEFPTITIHQVKSWIAWLEKQVEHKPFDYENDNIQQKDFVPKVEPKFKVGDFIANDYCFGKVIALTDDAYLLDTGQGIPFSCEHNTHLWTIADARNGDVLKEDSCIFILKKIKSQDTAITHCCLFDDGDFNLSSKICFDVDSTYPATKEQRDTLMKAMTDAGYTFDFERKELKKIKQKSAEWSEEDNWYVEDIISLLDFGGSIHTKEQVQDWLKSLKGRVQPHNQWKPSKEQMDALWFYAEQNNYAGAVLTSLYNDLKKLNGE